MADAAVQRPTPGSEAAQVGGAGVNLTAPSTAQPARPGTLSPSGTGWDAVKRVGRRPKLRAMRHRRHGRGVTLANGVGVAQPRRQHGRGPPDEGSTAPTDATESAGSSADHAAATHSSPSAADREVRILPRRPSPPPADAHSGGPGDAGGSSGSDADADAGEPRAHQQRQRRRRPGGFLRRGGGTRGGGGVDGFDWAPGPWVGHGLLRALGLVGDGGEEDQARERAVRRAKERVVMPMQRATAKRYGEELPEESKMIPIMQEPVRGPGYGDDDSLDGRTGHSARRRYPAPVAGRRRAVHSRDAQARRGGVGRQRARVDGPAPRPARVPVRPMVPVTRPASTDSAASLHSRDVAQRAEQAAGESPYDPLEDTPGWDSPAWRAQRAASAARNRALAAEGKQRFWADTPEELDAPGREARRAPGDRPVSADGARRFRRDAGFVGFLAYAGETPIGMSPPRPTATASTVSPSLLRSPSPSPAPSHASPITPMRAAAAARLRRAGATGRSPVGRATAYVPTSPGSPPAVSAQWSFQRHDTKAPAARQPQRPARTSLADSDVRGLVAQDATAGASAATFLSKDDPYVQPASSNPAAFFSRGSGSALKVGAYQPARRRVARKDSRAANSAGKQRRTPRRSPQRSQQPGAAAAVMATTSAAKADEVQPPPTRPSRTLRSRRAGAAPARGRVLRVAVGSPKQPPRSVGSEGDAPPPFRADKHMPKQKAVEPHGVVEPRRPPKRRGTDGGDRRTHEQTAAAEDGAEKSAAPSAAWAAGDFAVGDFVVREPLDGIIPALPLQRAGERSRAPALVSAPASASRIDAWESAAAATGSGAPVGRQPGPPPQRKRVPEDVLASRARGAQFKVSGGATARVTRSMGLRLGPPQQAGGARDYGPRSAR